MAQVMKAVKVSHVTLRDVVWQSLVSLHKFRPNFFRRILQEFIGMASQGYVPISNPETTNLVDFDEAAPNPYPMQSDQKNSYDTTSSN